MVYNFESLNFYIPPPPVDWIAVVESPARRNAAGFVVRLLGADITIELVRSAKDESINEAFILAG